jgi:hypothetical protein
MEREPVDFDVLLQERRESAAATMRPVTLETVREQITGLFSNPDHPWLTVVNEFLTSHKNTTAVHGSTTDGVEFIFFPNERKGFWFKISEGVKGGGPIMERGLAALSEIAKEKGLA